MSPRQHGGGRRHGRPRGSFDDATPIKERWVGRLGRRGRFFVAEPFFPLAGTGERGRRVNVDRVRDGREGDLVLVRSGVAQRGAPRIERVLGRPDVARVVLEALMLDRGLSRRFPAGVERAAEDARDAFDAAERRGPRRDLRDLPTFTIDPVTARDFDDAVSAEALGAGRFRVWVHIADVTAYVRPGTALDAEAYRRGTSVYVPGAVEPMLPEALSNDACSLRPHVDRLAVTVEMELDGADVVRTRFDRSIIRSDERLDYDRVDRIFAGEEPWGDPWAEPLRAARTVAAALDERRAERGALAIESAEPEFAFDRRGQVTGAHVGVQTESHRLIEHLMIAANEAVARLCAERGVPTLYRIHEHPDGEAVERLLEQLASLGVATPPAPERPTGAVAAEVVGAASQLIDQHVRRTGHGRRALTSLVLRALKQARYDPENRGHAGLGSPCYCHFTSPIRRYPDIIAHRALLSAVGGGEDPPRRGALDEAGEVTSARERHAMGVERAADDIARCFLLARELGNREDVEFDGEVIGVIGAGAFVAFGKDGGYEGMLPVRALRSDWYELNEAGTILHGADSGSAIRLGDPIRVVVTGIDVARGRVSLGPAAAG